MTVSFSRRNVTSRSTRVPGTTKPATPITSLTLTDIARMPIGMDGGRPAPASAVASLALVRGSFSRTVAIRPRLTTASMFVNAPGTVLAEGDSTSLTSSVVNLVPRLAGAHHYGVHVLAAADRAA